MANLKDLLVNGPSSLIGDVTITSLKIPTSSNGTEYSTGSNGQVLKSNGTSVYWANDNNTITANATDGLWDLTGTNGTNSVTYALAPYSSKQTTASFYTGTTAPSLSTRLNYDGYLYAKKLYSEGSEVITKSGGVINNSLTLQKSSTSPDSPELIFNGQAGNSEAYKWSIQKNSSGDLIFSKISSNNTSTTTIVFSANGYLLPNTTDTYDLGSSSQKWRNIYGNLKGNADTATSAEKATSDSDNNVIKDTYVKKSGSKMTGNLTSNATASLGTTSEPWHNIVLGGATNNVMTASSTNPRITFYEGTSGTQPVHLIYTDLDSYRSPAGLKVIGGTNATPAWFEVEGNIYVGSGNSTAGNCSILTEKALTFSYGGGWFMQDTTWIRATAGKGIYISGNSTFRADGPTQFKNLIHVDSNIVDNGKWITGATGTANSGDNNATQGTLGLSKLYIGNDIARPAAGTAGGANNSKGYLYIYGPDTTAGELSYNGSMFESDKSIYLRNNSDNGIANEVRGKCGTSDYWRIAGGATASNAGYVEIATADDGNEPIYIRQYNGTFSTIKRAATLLDANGNTNFPGNLVAKMGTFTGSATPDNNINEYYLYGGITIRESNNVGSTQSDFAYAPRLTFLWNNRTTATISLDSSGTLCFRRLDGETLTPLSANLNGNATTATSLSTSGTTAQFWRGDNTWSNILTQNQDSTISLSNSNSKIGTAIRTLHIATAGSASGSGLSNGVVAGITFGSSDQARGGIYYQASNTYGSRLYFATTSSFADGAYARMVIRQDGKVGIGVLDPDSLLHIKNGDLKVDNGQLTIKGASSSPASSVFNSSQLILYDSGSDVVGLELQRQIDSSGINSWQIINDNNTLKFKTGANSYNIEIITATSNNITTKKPLTVNSVSTAGTNSTPIYWNNGTPTAISSPIPVSLGGTGNSSYTSNRLLYTAGVQTISYLPNIYATDGQIGIGRIYSGTNSLTVDGDSEFYGNIYIDEDLEISGTLEVVGGSFIGGSNVTDYQGNLSKIIDSSSGNRFLTVAPYHSFSSNSWNINNDSKCIEIDFPTGLSGISIGFWIDFYSSTGIGSYCIYGEIPNNTNANSPWEHCHAFCMGSSNITQFPVLFCKDNNNGNSNKYKIFIGNGSSNIVKNIRERNFVIRDMTIHNISNIFNQQFLHSNLIITPKLLTSFPESGIDIDFLYYSPSIGDTPDYIYRITAINRDFKLQIFSGEAPFYYFDKNGNNICRANSNYYEYETFGSLIQDREYLIKFKVINSSSGRINITHTFNLQNNETYTLPSSSNGNSIGFTSIGFYSQAFLVSNYDLRKGETVEISCTLV